MMRILNSEQIKAVEAAADESGISYLRLMENAGAACAKVIRTRFDPTDKRRVVVLCGKGKNGGDGFVAARKLFENGYDVHVLLVAGEPKADNAREMFARLRELEIPAESYMPQSERQRALLQKADILIDAVFGTGFAGSLPENLQALFAFAETCGGFVVSIDLPSGVCADTPQLQSRPLKADLTVSVMALKPALVSFPAREFAGEIQVVSIGIPDELYKAYNKTFAFSDKDIAALFPQRAADANKGDFGKALVIAGSYEMPGAALLACGACVECGAGLVRLAFPEQAYAAVTAAVPEKVLLPLASNRFGRISAQEEKRLLDVLSNATACLVGCGLGLDYDTKAIVRAVLQSTSVPRGLDADGINAVCDDIDMIREAKAPVILTPHRVKPRACLAVQRGDPGRPHGRMRRALRKDGRDGGAKRCRHGDLGGRQTVFGQHDRQCRHGDRRQRRCACGDAARLFVFGPFAAGSGSCRRTYPRACRRCRCRTIGDVLGHAVEDALCTAKCAFPI